MHVVAVLTLALALDLALGDPPSRLHPVAWVGSILAGGRRWLCRGAPPRLLAAGAALTLGVLALAALAGVAITAMARSLGPAGILLEALALKLTLSPRGLAAAARSVGEALDRGDLDEARRRLGWHLVSRPTAALDPGQVVSGAVESVAENLTDALVAPIVFYLALGMPGALAYRALNTADTMLGYREGPLEYFGKIAARLDDVANILPARLAALALVAAAGSRASAACRTMRRDHARTASPNAGWTMAAMAGALGVTLQKPGAYTLGDGPAPVPAHIAQAIRLLRLAGALALVGLVALTLVI